MCFYVHKHRACLCWSHEGHINIITCAFSAVLGPCEVLDEGAYGARRQSGSAWNDQSVFLCRRRFMPSSGCAMHHSAHQQIPLVKELVHLITCAHPTWHGCPCEFPSNALAPWHLFCKQSFVVMLVVFHTFLFCMQSCPKVQKRLLTLPMPTIVLMRKLV